MSSVGSSNGITGTFGPNVTAVFNTTAPDYSQYPPLCVSALALVGQSCYSTALANTNIFKSIVGLKDLDPSLYPELQSGAGLIQKNCVATTTTTSTATKTQTSTTTPSATTQSSARSTTKYFAFLFAFLYFASSQ
ncbi:hypothetical protein HDV04_003646 [Boothiomyces sp. JEL0838]|nr:hypothetical protein HDV04_003646 [Boothiomyces sp. JEL0838]